MFWEVSLSSILKVECHWSSTSKTHQELAEIGIDSTVDIYFGRESSETQFSIKNETEILKGGPKLNN